MAPRSSVCLALSVFTGLLSVACSSDPDPVLSPQGGSGGTGTSGSAGSVSGGSGGSVATGGTNGVAGSVGTSGSGGSLATGGSGGSTTGGAGGSGTSGAGGSGGSGSGVACPADKTFCADFEANALPAGAVYKVNAAPGEWTRDYAVDTTVFRGGKSSLKVKASSDAGSSGSMYRMLAVPAPTGKFWVRFYIRQEDADIGAVDHNAFVVASDTDEPNSSVSIEMAEDVGLSFNTSDAVRWPMGFGRVDGNPKPFTLAKATWHCIEISYDSETRAQKLYVNGTLQIDATDYPMSVANPLKFFKFGFNGFHGPARAVWYDDVAVGPTRAGCL